MGCIKFLISPPGPGGGEFIKSVGEEYQVAKGGRKYQGCGDECNVKKGKGEAITSYIMILNLLGGISNWEEGKGD